MDNAATFAEWYRMQRQDANTRASIYDPFRYRWRVYASTWLPLSTNDNLQARHFDAKVVKRFGTLLPANWLCHNLVEATSAGDSYFLQHQATSAIHSKNQDNDIR